MRRLWLTSTSEPLDLTRPKIPVRSSVLECVLNNSGRPQHGRKGGNHGHQAPRTLLAANMERPVKHWTTRSAIWAAAGFIAAAAFVPAQAADISGAGATFPYPIYAKWADAYKKETGNGLNYQSIGSGGGIKQIKAKTVTFGASDAPLPGKELDEAGLAQFPMVMGGIVPVVNLDGIKPGDLTIDGPTLAKIFMGEITNWNDPALVKLNASIKLPDQDIAIVHRSDGSGTTFNFTYYLSDVSADWKSKVGTNTSVQWPAGIGAKGNEGVANNVANTKRSVGYVEYAYALQNKLTFTKMVNKEGKTVAPTSEAFQAAAANADWNSQPGFGVILANQPDAASWPMTAATWILTYKTAPDAAATTEALKFFSWSYSKGQTMAKDLDYVPMPANTVADIQKMWGTDIKDSSGKSLFALTH